MDRSSAVALHEAREAAERKAVEEAASPKAAHIHVVLADRHADMAWALGGAMDDGRSAGDV
jgi:hypothetical protein